MSQMVEKIAKQLFFWMHGHNRWDEAEPETREDACEAARAVIEEMQEPTDEMCIAAGLTQYSAGIYRDMMRAALN